MFLDMRPGLWRQIHRLADFPVADHRAQFFGGAIDKGLLFFGQVDLGVSQQLIPVGAAAEQLAIPPDRAGIDCIAFGLRHRWQGFLKPAEQWRSEQFAPQLRQQQQGGGRGQQ